MNMFSGSSWARLRHGHWETLVSVFLVDVWIPCAFPGRGSPVSCKDEGWTLTPTWGHGGLFR